MQPAAYAATPVVYARDPRQAKNWMNIVALVCSLAGLFTGVSAIVGVVFGHLGRAAAKRGEADNGNLGLAGLIVGYVIIGLGLAITIFYVVFFLALFASAGECDATDPNSWCYPTYD